MTSGQQQQQYWHTQQYSQYHAQQVHFDPKDWVIATWGLSKWYGLVLGLNSVTVGIKKGITGLLGPNGAGKSTLLKLVTGQIAPSQGRVWVLGQSSRHNYRLREIIGYCAEQDAFYHWMTGLQFVTYLTRLQGIGTDKAEKMAKKAIETVDMTAEMNRKISGYSKGMRQRIKVAQSMVHDPQLILLDEPLAGTDPMGRVRIMEVIRKLEDEGKDLLISSHVLHEVERMTENILLINKGRLLAQGNIHDVRDLIDKHPHIIRIETPEPRKLGRELEELEFVTALEFQPNMLIIRSPRPDLFYKELPKVVARTGIRYSHLSSPDDNLNAVFKYLTEG